MDCSAPFGAPRRLVLNARGYEGRRIETIPPAQPRPIRPYSAAASRVTFQGPGALTGADPDTRYGVHETDACHAATTVVWLPDHPGEPSSFRPAGAGVVMEETVVSQEKRGRMGDRDYLQLGENHEP